MIKHILIGQPISTVGGKLGLEGLEMYMKGDTTYLEHKGWIDLKTRQQVLDNYAYNDCHNSILIPILSEESKPTDEPSYEQQLMDKAALAYLPIYDNTYPNSTIDAITEYALDSAKKFISERKKHLL